MTETILWAFSVHETLHNLEKKQQFLTECSDLYAHIGTCDFIAHKFNPIVKAVSIHVGNKRVFTLCQFIFYILCII